MVSNTGNMDRLPGFLTGTPKASPQPGGQQPPAPPAPPADPKDFFYSDGINTPMEAQFLPMADPIMMNTIINNSKAGDERPVHVQGEITNRKNDSMELIDYNMKGSKDGKVKLEGKYGSTEFKEEYTPQGAFAAKMENFVKDSATGEFVKNGEVSYRDMDPHAWTSFRMKGSVAGIPIEEKVSVNSAKNSYTDTGKVGEMPFNYRQDHTSTNYETMRGNIGNNTITGELKGYQAEKYTISDRNIGNYRLREKLSWKDPL